MTIVGYSAGPPAYPQHPSPPIPDVFADLVDVHPTAADDDGALRGDYDAGAPDAPVLGTQGGRGLVLAYKAILPLLGLAVIASIAMYVLV